METGKLWGNFRFPITMLKSFTTYGTELKSSCESNVSKTDQKLGRTTEAEVDYYRTLPHGGDMSLSKSLDGTK